MASNLSTRKRSYREFESEWSTSLNSYIPAKKEGFLDYTGYDDELAELCGISALASFHRTQPMSALSAFQGPSFHATYLGNPPAPNTLPTIPYFDQNIYAMPGTFPENSRNLIALDPNGGHTSYQGASTHGHDGTHANPSPQSENQFLLKSTQWYTQQCHSNVNGFPSPGISTQSPGSYQGMNVNSAGLWEPQKYNSMTDIDYSLYNQSAETDNSVPNPALEICDILENVQPGIEIPKDRESTPDGLTCNLLEHQKLALTWLKQMEEGANKGGILADDMGLGKTISALALILLRPSKDMRRKTTLIVGPIALLKQWESEILTKINTSHRLTTFLYHSENKAPWETLRTFDIVLTTYGTLSVEYKKLQKWRDNPYLYDNRTNSKTNFVFFRDDSLWYRIILDEAQYIKNRNSKAALAAWDLQALTRFCLTGTPMMNGVDDLFSLICFLRIEPYNDREKFMSEFRCLLKPSKPSHQTNDAMRNHQTNDALRNLQALLKGILLRRTKTSIIDGNPIFILPEKVEEIVYAIFDEDEQNFYTALETKTLVQFNKYVKAGTIGKKDACAHRFSGADILLHAVEESIKLLGKEWYEEVTAEELAAIKAAMVSGPDGIATHSGHWYNCANGYPFAIGECGMPMEQARCPECGAPIGGHDHQAVQGVTRAARMEN